MKPILEIKKISKKFKINHETQPYLSFRDSLASLFTSSRTNKEEFYALRDISFNVNPGESIGIVGKNGAGKSTLLKILSKITPPSSGRIIARGRMASLLEVGTGFHPELTGRENVFLNGSILGMKKAEIVKNFDAIVDFAGVEKFLDTPLKHYSSGMQLRLAFAVAAFLENEILIIDEVLAVGDAEFQKKCMGKMKEVTGQGRTVLFVSHNMSAVSSLCSKAIWLEQGKMKMQAETEKILKLYMQGVSADKGTQVVFNSSSKKNGDETVKVINIQLINERRELIDYVNIDEKVGIKVEYEVLNDRYHPIPNFHISTSKGEKAFVSVEPTKQKIEKGKHISTMWIPENFLNEGTYYVGLAISTLNPVKVHFQNFELFYFDVVDNLDSVTRNSYTGTIDGVIRPLLEWKTE